MVSGKLSGAIEESAIQKESCPIVAAIKEIGGEWKMIVIRYLKDGPMGFNDLLKNIDGLNSKTLSTTLKYLESHGIVDRTVESTRPFRVKYSLSEKGMSLQDALKDLQKWGEDWAMNWKGH